jgi:thiamine-monophosphate kinase
MPEDPSLAQLGEWDLIDRLAAFAPPGQFADDAAVIAAGGTLVMNTDVLVDGVHFSDATTDGAAAGWRTAAANLSDLAAMGCTEVIGLTVGLVAPGHTRWSWVEGVYRGLLSCLQAHGGTLLGGDCSAGRQRMLAVTALGRLALDDRGEACAIRRGAGRPGDVLVSSGPHGLSRLGLALLQQDLAADVLAHLPAGLTQRARHCHRHPVPRLDVVAALHASRPAQRPWRVAGTDSSDGLAAAAAAIARESSCRALLDRDTLPLDPAMAGLPQAVAWCLSGGEDFELVLALENDWADALIARLPGCQRIGQLTEKHDDDPAVAWLGGPAAGPDQLPGPEPGGGYRHFS